MLRPITLKQVIRLFPDDVVIHVINNNKHYGHGCKHTYTHMKGFDRLEVKQMIPVSNMDKYGHAGIYIYTTSKEQ